MGYQRRVQGNSLQNKPKMSMGSVGDAKPADDIARQVASDNKDGIEGKTGESYDTFDVINYATQTVAGTNSFLKIDVGGDEAIHARVFRCLDGSYEVNNVQEGHTHDAEIKYF